MVLQRIVKPKTRRGKKFLEKCEPKLKENEKSVMFIKGKNTSNIVTDTLKDLFTLKRCSAVMYKRKNDILPFENSTSLEFFSLKSDASLFVFGNHSKKRPNNVIFGRLFNFEIIDMIEVGICQFKSINEFKTVKIAADTKPCLIFSGEAFDEDIEHQRLKSMFIDLFRGPTGKNVRLAGLEHVLSFTAIDGVIYMNSYRVLLKKSGTKAPRVELEEVGPALNFVIRRTKFSSADLFRRATKHPKIPGLKMRKNLSKDPFGTKMGRIHMERQDIDKLQTRKMKGLKRNRGESGGESGGDDDEVKKKKVPTATLR